MFLAFWEMLERGNIPYYDKKNDEVMEYILQGGRLSKPFICSGTIILSIYKYKR